jgi:hypothetical protein
MDAECCCNKNVFSPFLRRLADWKPELKEKPEHVLNAQVNSVVKEGQIVADAKIDFDNKAPYR